jgi:hypothetical protein
VFGHAASLSFTQSSPRAQEHAFIDTRSLKYDKTKAHFNSTVNLCVLSDQFQLLLIHFQGEPAQEATQSTEVVKTPAVAE